MIQLLVMDVDGTLTDGAIYIGDTGEVMKAFHVKDGYAIAQILPEHSIIPVIITGRKSAIVERRAEELHIAELHQDVGNKLKKLKEIADKYQVHAENIAYIGDDLNDLECIQYSGISGCPADAVEKVKNNVDYICKMCGGQGAVREFISWLICHQNIKNK